LRVVSMTSPDIAAKVTGMLLASAYDEATLMAMLAPERSGELRGFVAEAITVLRKAGKLPVSDYEDQNRREPHTPSPVPVCVAP